jgi:hypothetical protein
MKVLFLAIHDWANMAYMLARSLHTTGIEAEAVATKEDFDLVRSYPRRATHIPDWNELVSVMDISDIIVFMHSHPGLLEMPYNFRAKKCAVFHGGSEYREKPEFICELFNPLVYVSLTQTGGLLNLGAKNEVWLLPPIDVEAIKPVFTEYDDKPIVAHFPRGPALKGSEMISRVVGRLRTVHDFTYLYSPYAVEWPENMRRISRCDIYVAACKPFIDGKKYGGGIEITDLEAAAMGKIVVTHFTEKERYLAEYGSCPLLVANDEEQMERRLTECLVDYKEQGMALRLETRKWVEENHSFTAVGKRLKEALGI